MSVLTRRIARTLAAAALSVATAGTVIVGVAAPAHAFTDPDVSDCLDFKHSRPFFGTKQKIIGTSRCNYGSFGFRVHNWSAISRETSPCLRAVNGGATGWQWTKGRKNWAIIAC